MALANAPTSRRRRGRRGRWRAPLVLLVLVGAAGYVLITGGVPLPAPSDPADNDAVAAQDVTVAGILDDAVDNPDGSVTATLTEAETGALVRDGLARAQTPTLRDVTVDLVAADDGQPGRMIVGGRLDRQTVPVRATVDLDVVDGSVRPTVTDASVGPLAVPASVRRDLDAQLRPLALVAEGDIVVEDLRTTDTTLILTGRLP